MAFTLDVFKAYVDGMFDADDDIISDLRRYRAIKEALEYYSDDRPDSETDDVTGDAGKYYPIASNLTEWVEDFSFIKDIEYPAATIASDETPVYLEPEDWREDYWVEVSGTQTRYLYLPHHSPAATEIMRITYAVPYNWTASSVTESVSQTAHGFQANDYVYQDSSTWYEADDQIIATHKVTAVADENTFTAAILQTGIPSADFFAICNKAACIICRHMAAKFAKAGESTIRADSVRHISKSQEYAKRADEFCAAYSEAMGLGEYADETIHAASEFVDWDTAPDWPSGRQFLTHSRAVR